MVMKKEEKPHNPNLGRNWIAFLRAKSRSGNTAELVARIAAHTIMRQSREWVKFSQNDWLTETAMTISEYKLALSRAMKTGLIETKRMKFYGVVVTALKLSSATKIDLERLLKEPILDESSKEPIYKEKKETLTSFYKEEEDCVHSVHAGTGEDSEVKVPGKKGNSHVSPTVSEMLSNPIKGHKPVALSSAATLSSLSHLWRETNAEIYSDYQTPLTRKQKGQLKSILNSLGSARAHKCINKVIRHWIEFAEAAKATKGWKIVPPRPDIGWLLLNIQIAANMLSEPNSVPEVMAKAKPVATIKKIKPKGQLATLEEVLSKES